MVKTNPREPIQAKSGSIVESPRLIPLPPPKVLAKILPMVELPALAKLEPKPKPVRIPREKNPLVLERAQERVVPDKSYTLTEAAELSRIPRKRWLRWASPGDVAHTRRVQSSKRFQEPQGSQPDYVLMVPGSEILRIVAHMSELPPQTMKLQELSELLGRSHGAVLTANIVDAGGEKHFSYVRNSDGKTLLVPLYRDLDDNTYLVNDRDYLHVEADFLRIPDLFEWSEAHAHMESKGVDVDAAELRSELGGKLRTRRDGQFSLPYASPDGKITEIPVKWLIGKCGSGRSYQITREDLRKLISVVLDDQRNYVPHTNVQEELGLTHHTFRGLTNKGRSISVDGKSEIIRLYRRRGVSLMKRSHVALLKQWKQLSDERREHVPVLEAVCRVKGNSQRTGEIFKQFLASLEEVDMELVHPVSSMYGLGVRIRELDGVYYVRKHHDKLLKFYLNITHSNHAIRIRTAKRLLKDVLTCKEPDVLLISKLWIAREVFVTLPQVVTTQDHEVLDSLDNLLKRKKVTKLLEQYDLDVLQDATSLPGVDLRYRPATNDPLLLAMLSRQGMDMQTQFSSTWLSW